MSNKETIRLSHPKWDEPKDLPKEQALRLLKNQKMPNVPSKFRNLYKIVKVKEEANESSTDSGSNKGTDRKAEKRDTTSKS